MNQKYMIFALCAALAGAASAQDKATAQLAARQVAVRNTTVEHTDNNLVVNMDLVLDSLDMPSNIRFVFTPVVRGDGQERFLQPVVINGRKQQIMFERNDYKQYDEQATVVRRKNNEPQTVRYAAVVPYEDWMKNADVAIYEDLCGCGDLLDQSRTVVRRLRTPLYAFIRPQAEAVKARELSGQAYIDFPVDRIELHPDYRNNPAELQKIIQTINVVKEDKNTSITGIEIHGYASPEGTYEHNTWLAENRARTLTDYVRQLVNLDNSLFHVTSTPEDWDGLRQRVAEGNLAHGKEILTLIDDVSLEPDPKEWKIKSTYPEDYRFMLDTWYPALRHSDYVISYSVRPFSVEEAKALLHTKPQQLSLEEMYLVAQTYETGSPEFNEVFQIAVRMFPNDPTANLNAACTALSQKDYDAARRYLDKAGTTPQANNARGVLAMQEGRIDEARAYFRQAADAGLLEAADNLKNLDNF